MELHWQHKFYEIKERGFHLLQTEKLADCRFLVGSTPCNQKMIAGHKLILAMASPVFERMFYGQLAEKGIPIVIPDVQPDIFQSMLEYIYSDRINISNDIVCQLYYVAKKYMLPHVVEQCTTFMLANINTNNACRVYEFAKLFDDPRLMNSSMEVISRHTQTILADPGFTDIEISTLMAILDQEKLNIASELNLFSALVRFANKRMLRNESLPDAVQNNEKTSSESASGENGETLLQFDKIKMKPNVNAVMQGHDDANCHHSASSPDVLVAGSGTSVADASANKVAFPVSCDQPLTSAALVAANAQNPNNYIMETKHSVLDEDMLKKAIKKIRFLTMTPQEFAAGPARSKLLQKHDALAILIKILSPSTEDCPMPEGFCISLRSRKYYERSYNFCQIRSTSTQYFDIPDTELVRLVPGPSLARF